MGMMERQITNILDEFEAERSTRRTETESTASLIDDSRQALLEESKVREMLEDRHIFDTARLTEMIESSSSNQLERLQEQNDHVSKIARDLHDKMEAKTKQVNQVRVEMESFQDELKTRMLWLEDRSLALENRVNDAVRRQQVQFDELMRKTDAPSAAVQVCQLDKRGRDLSRSIGGFDSTDEVNPDIPVLALLDSSMPS